MMFLLLLCLNYVSAHVRLVFTDEEFTLDNRPIRNASSASGDGRASVEGPCGGNLAWGANGSSSAEAGDEVTVKFNYGANHPSNANLLQARWACNQPSSNELKSVQYNMPIGNVNSLQPGQCASLRCPVSGQYPCAAPDAQIDNGYVFKCRIPSDALNQDCTLSIVDQRDWGGCLDISVSRSVAGVDQYTLDEHTGSYDYQAFSESVDVTSGAFASCCCGMTGGSFTVTKNNSNASLNGSIELTCPSLTGFSQLGLESSLTVTLNDVVMSPTTAFFRWVGSTTIKGYDFETILTDKKLFFNYKDSVSQLICDVMLDKEVRSTSVLGTTQACPENLVVDESGRSLKVNSNTDTTNNNSGTGLNNGNTAANNETTSSDDDAVVIVLLLLFIVFFACCFIAAYYNGWLTFGLKANSTAGDELIDIRRGTVMMSYEDGGSPGYKVDKYYPTADAPTSYEQPLKSSKRGRLGSVVTESNTVLPTLPSEPSEPCQTPWYYIPVDEDKTVGPVLFQELSNYCRHITYEVACSSLYVWNGEDVTEWVTIQEVNGLLEKLKAANTIE